MKTFVIVVVIVTFLVLIGLIPVGAEAAYDGDGFRLTMRIWFFRVRLGGNKREAAENSKESEAPDRSGRKKEKSSRGRGDKLSLVRKLAKHGFKTLCRLVSRLRVDVLRLHFTSAFSDPAVTAMAYAAAGTAMDGLMRVGRGHIAFSDMMADVDFDSDSPTIDLLLVVRLRVGRIVAEALRFGVCFLTNK